LWLHKREVISKVVPLVISFEKVRNSLYFLTFSSQTMESTFTGAPGYQSLPVLHKRKAAFFLPCLTSDQWDQVPCLIAYPHPDAEPLVWFSLFLKSKDFFHPFLSVRFPPLMATPFLENPRVRLLKVISFHSSGLGTIPHAIAEVDSGAHIFPPPRYQGS